MKPSWDDAPKWANFLAKDENGKWCWHQMKPTAAWSGWLSRGHLSLAHDSGVNDANWRETLEERTCL